MNIPQLTFTRFVAALCIVVLHFGMLVYPFNLPFLSVFINYFPSLVSYFFVLSGFILVVAHARENPETFDWKKFWVHRFARIYPVYLVALLIVFFFVTKADTFFDYFGWNKITVNHLLMLQAWNPDFVMYYNFPAWSLSAEMFFYLCFPFLFRYFYSLGWKPLVMFSVLFWITAQIALYLMVKNKVNENLVYYFPLLHLPSFTGGVSAGFVFLRYQEWLKKNKLFIHIATVLLTVLMITMILSDWEILKYYRAGLFLPFFISVIYSISLAEGRVVKLFSSKGFVYAGSISYSLYILQIPLAIYLLERKNIFSDLEYGVKFWIYLGLLILVSALSYELIEKPAREKINKMAYQVLKILVFL